MKERIRNRPFGRCLIGCLATVLLLGLTPDTTFASDWKEKFQIFGFLTQAYGRSSRGSILGTEEDGTTDLGNVAVQFRWTPSTRDSVVVQIAHERRGDDLFLPADEDLDIDWAFYQRQLRENTVLKVGRLNIPLGIYNEIRDVGTLLPFFNLPISFYSGVLSSAETVDGVSITHTFAARSEWDLEATAYYGGWDTFQQRVDASSEFGLVNLDARAEDGLGLQLWLDTPVQGLRFGGGIARWVLEGDLVPDARDNWDAYHFSVDLSREHWIARAEVRHWEFEQDFGAFFDLPMSIPGEAERDGWYAQVGYWVTPKIGFFAQYEDTSLDDDQGLNPELDEFHEEAALSFNYRFNPDLLVRVEYHTAETRLPLGLPGAAPSEETDVDWTIVALSVSF